MQSKSQAPHRIGLIQTLSLIRVKNKVVCKYVVCRSIRIA